MDSKLTLKKQNNPCYLIPGEDLKKEAALIKRQPPPISAIDPTVFIE